MATGGEVPQSSRLSSLVTQALGSVVFAVMVTALNWFAKALFAGTVASSVRARATVELTGAMIAEVLVLILLVLFLRRRGVPLRRGGKTCHFAVHLS